MLKYNHINEDNVNFNYLSSVSELGPMILSGKVKYAILPEPVLSTVLNKESNLKVICSLNDE